MSSIEDRVCEKIQGRSEIGKAKYGVTMERRDLDFIDWLKHLQEELMDAAVYVEKLMSDVEELKRLAHLRDENDLTNICMECGLSDCTC